MIYTIAILLSLVGYFVIGHLAGRRVKGLDDYLVAGRNAPTFFILGTLAASPWQSSRYLLAVGCGAYGDGRHHLLDTGKPGESIFIGPP